MEEELLPHRTSIEEDMVEAYLTRGKCAYLVGDTSLAFMDFQKIIMIEPKNPDS